jgi:hypothetical protein
VAIAVSGGTQVEISQQDMLDGELELGDQDY